jgi:hypothetical protein
MILPLVVNGLDHRVLKDPDAGSDAGGCRRYDLAVEPDAKLFLYVVTDIRKCIYLIIADELSYRWIFHFVSH